MNSLNSETVRARTMNFVGNVSNYKTLNKLLLSLSHAPFTTLKSKKNIERVIIK